MSRNVLSLIVSLVLLPIVVALWWRRDSIRQSLIGEGSLGEPLTVGTNVWPGYEPLYLAHNLRLYGENIRLVEYSSATDVIRALRNKLIDVGALTLDEVLLLRQGGFDVRVILATDISDGGDVIMARPEIAGLADLKGCRVGVESTALGAYVLTRALQTANLSSADIQVIPLEVDEHLAAYNQEKVDAVVTFEPVRSQLLNDGAQSVFDSSLIPGEIVDVLVVRGDLLEQRGAELGQLIDGWFEALKYLSEQPEDASKRMAGRLNLLPEEALGSFEGLKLPTAAENMAMFDHSHSSSLWMTAEKLERVMMDSDLLDSEIDIVNLIAPQFVQAHLK